MRRDDAASLVALGNANEKCYGSLVEHYLQCSGGLYDGAKEAIYEAKASEEGPPGTRNRRGVLFVDRRSDRISERADSRYTVPEYLSASRNLPR
jgi:hypothetical protein